jgi:3'-phosphoadenosine 5'-phosphosulfate sulfotransferase (PAPS reductase)/FAD synthetase
MREAVGEFKNPVMLHSVGKDSGTIIRLPRRHFSGGDCSLEVSKERDRDGLC